MFDPILGDILAIDEMIDRRAEQIAKERGIKDPVEARMEVIADARAEGEEMSEGIYPVGEIKADWSKKPSPWHTGIPTEAGWYVFDFGSSGGQYENLVSLEYLSIHQIERYKRTNRFKDTKWQKIELEKGN